MFCDANFILKHLRRTVRTFYLRLESGSDRVENPNKRSTVAYLLSQNRSNIRKNSKFSNFEIKIKISNPRGFAMCLRWRGNDFGSIRCSVNSKRCKYTNHVRPFLSPGLSASMLILRTIKTKKRIANKYVSR